MDVRNIQTHSAQIFVTFNPTLNRSSRHAEHRHADEGSLGGHWLDGSRTEPTIREFDPLGATHGYRLGFPAAVQYPSQSVEISRCASVSEIDPAHTIRCR